MELKLYFYCVPYQLIEAALDGVAQNEDFRSASHQNTLLKRVAALHVVYMLNRSQIMWFGQLVSQHPSILLSLKDKLSSSYSEMVCS